MADVTMAHPDYLAAPQEIRYDGPIGPELWETLRQRMAASPGHVGRAVLADGLQLKAYYRLRDQADNGTGLTLAIYRHGPTTDEAWRGYMYAILSILPDGDWWPEGGRIGPDFCCAVLTCYGPAPTGRAA